MALTKEQAAMLARQNPDLVRKFGVTGPALIARIMAEADLQGVTGEPPTQLTPATPAPMQATQLQAPAPTQQQLGPQPQDDMAQYRQMQADQQARIAQQIEDNARRIQQVEAGAVVPEEVQQVLAQREARYAGQEAQLEKDNKGAIWDAIAQAGFKMAQSQSPYFASALAEGMSAGLTGYDEAKAKAAEKKARLQDQKEQVTLDRYGALTKARAAAREGLMAGLDLTSKTVALANANDEAVLNLATMKPKIAAATANATIADVNAQYAPLQAQATLESTRANTYRTLHPVSGGSGDGLGEKLFLKQYDAQQEAAKDLQDAITDQDAAKYAVMADPENPELLGKMNAARVKAQAALTRARSLGVGSAKGYTLRGGPAGQPVAKGANYSGFSIVK